MLLVVSVCLQILNSFNVSGMDEATLFKFGKWVEYGRVHLGVKNFQWKGHGLGHVTHVKNFNPFNTSGMDEAALFKVVKWIDYSNSHPGVNIFPNKRDMVWVTWPF